MKSTIQNGSTVSIDYTLTVDGKVVDSSQGRGPLKYVQGGGQIIPGLEHALAGLAPGDKKQVTVNPEDGYGAVNPEALIKVAKAQVPAEAQVGQTLRGTNRDGKPFIARVQSIEADMVTLDFNHPLAGKTLRFDISVVDVSPTQ